MPRAYPPHLPPARSLGHFLCHQPADPSVEDTERLPLRDIKQDACLRALVALSRAGKPIGPDPIAAFDAEPRLVRAAYSRAYRDALRFHIGRGTGPDRRAARWRRLVSLDQILTEIADPRQGEALDDVVRIVTATARLVALDRNGLPNASPALTRRLIRLLRHTQRLKDEGTTAVPGPLREQLRLIRRQLDLPISTRVL